MTVKVYQANNRCSMCSSIKEIERNGFIVCTNCGMTKDRQYVDHSPSYTKNGITNFQNSIGKNIDYVGALGSQIGYNSGYLKGSRGSKLQAKVSAKYYRLIRLHHNRARIEGNATHLRTMIAFTRVFNSLNISKTIKNRSLHLYWKHVKSGKKITNHVLLIALSLLQSVREAEEQAPIRFSEIIQVFANNGHRVTNKNILRLARELNIALGSKSRRPEDYINRIASDIKASEQIIERLAIRKITPDEYEMLLIFIAQKFLNRLGRKDRGGVQPYPFAVSIIYLSDRVFAKITHRKPILTQHLLANAAGSAEFTIRDHVYRFLGNLYKIHEPFLIFQAHQHLNNKKIIN